MFDLLLWCAGHFECVRVSRFTLWMGAGKGCGVGVGRGCGSGNRKYATDSFLFPVAG